MLTLFCIAATIHFWRVLLGSPMQNESFIPEVWQDEALEAAERSHRWPDNPETDMPPVMALWADFEVPEGVGQVSGNGSGG